MVEDNKYQLYQPATPFYGLESWTDFTIIEPYYIDVVFRCKPTRATFKKGYIGLFWANYINAPENKAMYFYGRYPQRDGAKWIAFTTHYHGHNSTVVHVDDMPDLPFIATENKNWLFTNYSVLRYIEPFYFGLFKDMVLIYMFDRTQGIRFTHSPQGGGTYRFHDYENPAWDFQYIIPNPQINDIYSFRCRFAYKKYAGREDVMQEYRKWQECLESKKESRQ